MIERKAVNAVQIRESGVVLEGISFNLSDSIGVQISAENERIEGLSENEKFHAIFTHLLQSSKLREILKRIRVNGGKLVLDQTSTDQKYDERMGAMLSEERASN